jgi:methionyl-tRNA formyltransferase
MAKTGEVKLFGARVSSATTDGPAGEVMSIDTNGMTVACGAGAVQIRTVQPAGKRRLAPQDWARGRGTSLGERLF